MRWNQFPDSTKRTLRFMSMMNILMAVVAIIMWVGLGLHDAIIPFAATAITAAAIVALYFTIPIWEEPSEADDIKFLLEQLDKKYEDRDVRRIDAIMNRIGK